MSSDQTTTVTGSQLILAAITATMAVVSYVARLSPEFSALVLAALTAWFVVAAWAWPRFLVARGRVLEERAGDKVLAGDANNMVEPGEIVRPYVPERALNESE